MYCNKDPCQAPATHRFTTDEGTAIFLCLTCKEAFEWGQARPEVTCVPIDCPVDYVQEWCVERDNGAIIWVKAFTPEEARQTAEDLGYTVVSVSPSGDDEEIDDVAD